jgi:hypothetical protein
MTWIGAAAFILLASPTLSQPTMPDWMERGSRPRLQIRSPRVRPSLSWHKITFYRLE